MRQGPRPPDSRVVVEIPVPVEARIHRVRRQKPERAFLLVRAPGSLPCLDGAAAPVAAALTFPIVPRTTYWPVFGRAAGLAYVRHDGERFWRPMSAHGTCGPTAVGDLDARIAGWASGDEMWPEWPYSLDKRRFGAGRLALVPAEGLALRSCSVNPAASHAEEVGRLAEKLCLIDGAIHVRCGEPVLDVVVHGLSKGKATSIAVAPSAGAQLDPEVEADVVQTFAGADPGPAQAYAADLSSVTGLPFSAQAAWHVVGDALRRDDARDAPAEGLARIAARTHRLVGALPRPAAESWLDLREAGKGAPDAAAALERVRALLALLPSDRGLLPTLLRWEALRWEGAMPEEDAAALGELA